MTSLLCVVTEPRQPPVVFSGITSSLLSIVFLVPVVPSDGWPCQYSAVVIALPKIIEAFEIVVEFLITRNVVFRTILSSMCVHVCHVKIWSQCLVITVSADALEPNSAAHA